MEASHDDNLNYTAMTLDEQLAIKSRLQARLTTITSAWHALGVQYRRLGLLYHSIPLSSRKPETTIKLILATAFEVTDPKHLRIITYIRDYHRTTSMSKRALWKFSLSDAEIFVHALEHDVHGLRKIVTFLQTVTDEVDKADDWKLPVSAKKDSERFRAFASWLCALPEIDLAISKKLGVCEDAEGVKRLYLAIEALNELEGLKLEVEGVETLKLTRTNVKHL